MADKSFLADYEERTAWKNEPVRGAFHTHKELAAKVNADGSYAPFPGCTAVFRPDRLCREVIPLIARVIREKAGDPDLLADPLPDAGIHMTLHDLVSPEFCRCDPADPAAYRHETAESLEQAAETTEQIRREYAGCRITMLADRIVNMVSKSLVLLLKPRSEQDGELLAELYSRFDRIRHLPYPLTPHITLAYFRPGVIDGDRLGAALDFAQIRPQNAPAFEFCAEALTAQYFGDMRAYTDRPERVCFCCDGGLNRSVMAANIVNHLARRRNLPVLCEARSAFQNTQGRPVPAEIRETLRGRTTVLAGPSGVGKSSLTNRLFEDAYMEVGELSRKIRRGRQTTRHTELIALKDEDSYVLDTPGFTSLFVSGVASAELQDHFEEFAPHIADCRFTGCSHVNEGTAICGVRQAVERGEVSPERYENYCQIYGELKERESSYR